MSLENLYREMHTSWNGGDWTTNPWFLRPENREATRARGFSEADLHAACEALRYVYPPRFCREALGLSLDPANPGRLDDDNFPVGRSDAKHLVTQLFKPWMLWWESVLGLGVDLALVRPKENDPSLRKRLQSFDGFGGAELEVQIWANANRAGWKVQRPHAKADEKRPEFLVHADLGTVQSVWLEVKTLQPGDGERAAYTFGGWDGFFAFDTPTGLCISISTPEHVRTLPLSREGRAQLEAACEALREAVQEALSDAAAAGWNTGTYPARTLATVTVAPPSADMPAGVYYDLFEDGTDESHARRAGPVVREAAKQVSAMGGVRPGVVFLDVPGDYDPMLVGRAIDGAINTDLGWTRHLDAVLIRRRAWDHSVSPPTQRWHTLTVRPRWSRIPPPQLQRLAAGLVASPHRLITPVQAAAGEAAGA